MRFKWFAIVVLSLSSLSALALTGDSKSSAKCDGCCSPSCCQPGSPCCPDGCAK